MAPAAPCTRTLGTLLAVSALAAATSCTSPSSAGPPASPTPSNRPTAAPTSPAASPSAEPALLPPDFTACVSPGTPRPLLVQDGGLRAGAPLTITKVTLEKPAGLGIADAWIGPGSAQTDATSDFEWPLATSDAQRLGAAWSGRWAAEGARLEPGKRYVLWLHLEPRGHESDAGYDSVLVDYRTPSGSFRGHGAVSVRFGQGC